MFGPRRKGVEATAKKRANKANCCQPLVIIFKELTSTHSVVPMTNEPNFPWSVTGHRGAGRCRSGHWTRWPTRDQTLQTRARRYCQSLGANLGCPIILAPGSRAAGAAVRQGSGRGRRVPRILVV